jgi:GNAT superfamily N-acetyltransferase
MTAVQGITFRDRPRASDAAAVREIVASTGFFHDFEVDVAVELIDERLARGIASEYFFIFADDERGRTLGYICFGPIACTVGSFDLYWIAVHDQQRGGGLGRQIVEQMEAQLRRGVENPSGPDRPPIIGRRVYIETSSKAMYEPTRRFYLKRGYHQEARFADFYAPGDDKLVYVKALT